MDDYLNNISEPPPLSQNESAEMTRFKDDFGNTEFQTSIMTYIAFASILFFEVQGFFGDSSEILKNLNETLRLVLYIGTIGVLWFFFGIFYLAVYLEKTNLKGIGFRKFGFIDIFRGIALLLTLFATASVLTLGLSQIGFEIPGEIGMMLPEKTLGKILFAVMSLTAGICEETIFRGYLLTRIRLLGKFDNWVVPVILSSILFGIPHLYEGVAGMIVIAVLGVLFAVTYIRYKTIWPCVFAHFFLDFLQLFVPQIEQWFQQFIK